MAKKAANASGLRRANAATKTVKINVVRLAHAKGLDLPAYQSAQAAGMDLVAAIGSGMVLKLNSGRRALVPTGLQLELPAGYEAQIRPRSGLAFRHGITVLNSPGTIDADYRGEVQVLLVNLGEKAFMIERGERVAQMVIAPVTRGVLVEAKALTTTTRGAGGFGSSGKKTEPTTKAPLKRAKKAAVGRRAK